MGQILSRQTTILDSLPIIPGSVKQTQGPTPGGNSDCPICQEPFGLTAPNLEHTKCRRRFHEQCLGRWLPDGTTCPLCRVQIVIRDLYEINEDDRVEFVRQARQQRSPPIEYHVMTNINETVRTIWSTSPSILKKEIVENVKLEIKLADEMFDALGPRVEAEALAITEILRRPRQYHLNDRSMNDLWILSRLLGVTHVFLAQMRDARGLGFWVPILPYYDAMPAATQVDHMTRFYRAGSRSSVEQIPLLTVFIRDRLVLHRGFRHETVNFSDIMSEMEKVARDGDETFWCVFDYPSRNGGPSDICLVPWPRDSIIHSFQTRTYPGHSPRGRPSTVSGWASNFDRAMLASVVDRHRWLAVGMLLTDQRSLRRSSREGLQGVANEVDAANQAMSVLGNQDHAMGYRGDIAMGPGENEARHDVDATTARNEVMLVATEDAGRNGEVLATDVEELDEDVYMTADEDVLGAGQDDDDPIFEVLSRIYGQQLPVVVTDYW